MRIFFSLASVQRKSISRAFLAIRRRPNGILDRIFPRLNLIVDSCDVDIVVFVYKICKYVEISPEFLLKICHP